MRAENAVRLTSLLLLSVLVASTALAACSEGTSAPPDTSSAQTAAAPVTETSAKPEETFDPNTVDAKSLVNFEGLSTTKAKLSKPAEKSAIPTVTVASHSENKQIFIAGKCEIGAVIHMRGGLEDKLYTTDHGDFMGIVNIPAEGTTEITVTAEETGKAESDPIVLTVKARDDVNITERRGVYGVIVGNDFQGHIYDALPDYIGKNLFTEQQLVTLKGKIEEKVKHTKSLKEGAELIYLMIPNPSTIYPETIADQYEHYTGVSKMQQFISVAREAGATVIDLTEVFTEHRDDEFKLFHKTDAHWTEYGAYIAYRELTTYISDRWPDAAPRPESDFIIYNKEVNSGDLATHLEFDRTLLKEYDSFVDFKFTSPSDPDIYQPGCVELHHPATSAEQTIHNTDESRTLPRVYIIRDSFCSAAFGLFNDAFSSIRWQATWKFNYNKDAISQFNPDYVIYLMIERNVRNIVN